MGGNRKGKVRCEINKLIVFFLTGLWHGANWTFIIWGMIHGVANVFEDTVGKVIKIKNKVISNILTWIVVISAFVMFRADNVSYGLKMLKNMFTAFNVNINSISYVLQLLSPYYAFILILAILFSYSLREGFENKIIAKIGNEKAEVICYVADIVLLVLCIMNLATATYNPFIYFRF